MKETTFYRFYSEVRRFIEDLFRAPLDAEVPEYLKERGFTKKKLIRDLLDRKVLDMSEKILDKSNSDKDRPTYSVKFKRHVPEGGEGQTKRQRVQLCADNFERKMKRMYAKYFEKNLPCGGKAEITEDGGGASSCGSVGGSYVTAMDMEPVRRPIHESASRRRIVISTEQLRLLKADGTKEDIEEATTTMNTGALGDYTANGLVLKTSDGRKDPSYSR